MQLIMKTTKIVIFGATGSVGAYTTIYLAKLGYEVIAVGHRKSDNGFFADYGIPYYSVDIIDSQNFSVLPEKDVDTVIHFAGAMPAHMCNYNPYRYVDSIITGTLNVLNYMQKCGADKIIFSQSISDILYKFGSTTPISPYTDKHFPLTGDHSIYSICKNAAVDIIEHYSAQYGIKRYILRLPTIYLYHPNPYYYVNGSLRWMGYRKLIDNAIKGIPIEIWGNPKNIKEMVYIKDFTQLVWRCVNSDSKGGIYNAGCGHCVTFEEQVDIIRNLFSCGKVSDIIYKPDQPSSPQFVLDIENAKTELGYDPVYDCKSLYADFKKEMDSEPFAKLWGRKEDYKLL